MLIVALAVVLGAFVPVAIMPGWAQAVVPVMPTYWAMRGMRSVVISSGGWVTSSFRCWSCWA